MIILKPYEGAGPIVFGMNAGEVATLIGSPRSSAKNRRGETVLRYEKMHITLSNEGVVEVELLPESGAYLSDVEVFSDPHALRKLCALDGAPKECLGAVILMNLGASVTGLHNQEDNQKSISVFARGRFDVLRSQMEPFSSPT
jgi:hypothetical protein